MLKVDPPPSGELPLPLGFDPPPPPRSASLPLIVDLDPRHLESIHRWMSSPCCSRSRCRWIHAALDLGAEVSICAALDLGHQPGPNAPLDHHRPPLPPRVHSPPPAVATARPLSRARSRHRSTAIVRSPPPPPLDHHRAHSHVLLACHRWGLKTVREGERWER
jgi:hypothetical protein